MRVINIYVNDDAKIEAKIELTTGKNLIFTDEECKISDHLMSIDELEDANKKLSELIKMVRKLL
jgi:hypothetical protein